MTSYGCSFVSKLFHRCKEGEVLMKARAKGETYNLAWGVTIPADAFIFVKRCACGKKFGEIVWTGGNSKPKRIDADLAEAYIQAYGLPEIH
jgi:hypothetical protein